MQNLGFYDMAKKIVGSVPPTDEWMYSFVCLGLICGIFMFLAFVIGRFWK